MSRSSTSVDDAEPRVYEDVHTRCKLCLRLCSPEPIARKNLPATSFAGRRGANKTRRKYVYVYRRAALRTCQTKCVAHFQTAKLKSALVLEKKNRDHAPNKKTIPPPAATGLNLNHVAIVLGQGMSSLRKGLSGSPKRSSKHTSRGSSTVERPSFQPKADAFAMQFGFVRVQLSAAATPLLFGFTKAVTSTSTCARKIRLAVLLHVPGKNKQNQARAHVL